jgi:Mlc titration factor MtfA (ptsG expression regulator)
LLLALGGALGALLDGRAGAAVGAAAGLGAGLALRRGLGRRGARRRAALSRPFPRDWRTLLEEGYEHYGRLPGPLRRRFEDDTKLFLAEKRITGVHTEVTDELRVLVAASAVTLSVGWPDADWHALTEVLLYPDDFDRDYSIGGEDLSGEAHPWGTVILSAPALLESFQYPDDGYHVGLHEFAHLLDLHQTEFDGIPAGLDEASTREWADLAPREMASIRGGRSVLDGYGGEDPVEFFAVAVETFFERPVAMRRRHDRLYALLSAYFAQDPASWEEARRPASRARRRGRRPHDEG